MKKKIIPIVILAVMIIGTIGGWQYFKNFNQSANHQLSASGIIEATEVLVSSEVGGQVTKLLLDEGQSVTAGQVLAEIEKAPILAQSAQAEADAATAQAGLTQAQADYFRAKRLFLDKIISQDQFQKAATAFNMAQSRLKAAQARQDYLKTQLNKTTITAPLAGTVTKKFIEAGELVSPGLPVTSIVDLKDVWVKVFIPEEQIGLIKLGQSAKIFLDSFPNQSFDGRVSYIAETSEFTPKNVQTKKERVRLVLAVKIKVDNQNDQFKPGLPADVEIIIQ